MKPRCERLSGCSGLPLLGLLWLCLVLIGLPRIVSAQASSNVVVTVVESDGSAFHDPPSLRVEIRASGSQAIVTSRDGADQMTFVVPEGAYRASVVWHGVVLVDEGITAVAPSTLIELRALERVTVFVVPEYSDGSPHRSALIRVTAPDGADVTDLFPGIEASLADQILGRLILGTNEFAATFALYPLDLTPTGTWYKVDALGRIPPNEFQLLSSGTVRFTTEGRFLDMPTEDSEESDRSRADDLVRSEVDPFLPDQLKDGFARVLPIEPYKSRLDQFSQSFISDTEASYAQAVSFDVLEDLVPSASVRGSGGAVIDGSIKTVEVVMADGTSHTLKMLFEGAEPVQDLLAQVRTQPVANAITLKAAGGFDASLARLEDGLNSLETVRILVGVNQAVAWIRDLSWVGATLWIELKVKLLKALTVSENEAEELAQEFVDLAIDGLMRVMLDEAFARSLESYESDVGRLAASLEDPFLDLTHSDEAVALVTLEQFLLSMETNYFLWIHQEWDDAGWEEFVLSAGEAAAGVMVDIAKSKANPLGSNNAVGELISSIGGVSFTTAKGFTRVHSRLLSLANKVEQAGAWVSSGAVERGVIDGIRAWAAAKEMSEPPPPPDPTFLSVSPAVVTAGDSFELSWSPVASASEYVVQWSSSSGFGTVEGERTLPSFQTKFSHIIAAAGVVRYYRVVESSAGPSNVVSVTTVEPPGVGELIADPSSIEIAGFPGGFERRALVKLAVNGEPSFDWLARKSVNNGDPRWISFLSGTTTESGNESKDLTVRIDPGFLGSAGTYTGTVTVESSQATNSPIQIPVTLTLSSSSGGAGADLAVVDVWWTSGRAPGEDAKPEINWRTQNIGSGTANSSGFGRDRVYLSDRPNLTIAELAVMSDVVNESWDVIAAGSSMTFTEDDRGLAPAGRGRFYYYVVADAADLRGEPRGFVSETNDTDQANTNNVFVFEVFLPRPPVLRVEPSALAISLEAGSVSSETIEIHNDGDDRLDWQASASDASVTLSRTSGAVAGESSSVATVVVDSENLAPGEYAFELSFAGNGGTVLVPLSVSVTSSPVLALSAATVVFDAVRGRSQPSEKAVEITNTGTGSITGLGATISYASAETGWLTAVLSDTAVPASLELSVDQMGLPIGVHSATVEVSSPDPVNSPVVLQVTLTVVEPGILETSVGSLSWSIAEGDTPDPLPMVLTNVGGSSMNWSAESQDSWISLQPRSGQLPEGANASLTVGVDPRTLGLGTTSGEVRISAPDADGAPRSIGVEVTVEESEPDPSLELSSSDVELNAVEGADPTPRTVTIRNTGGGELAWSATAVGSWITVSLDAGRIPSGEAQQLAIGADVSGLPPGTYEGAVSISGSQSAEIQVRLVLQSSGASGRIGLSLGANAEENVPPGGPLTIPILVDLSEAAGLDIASLQVRANWDETMISYVSFEPGSFGVLTVNDVKVGEGDLTASVFSAQGTGTSFTMLTLNVVAGSIEGSTRLDLFLDAAGSEAGLDLRALVSIRNLEVCVAQGGIWGDINRDETANIIDAQQIARFSVGLPVANLDDISGLGDVTADGLVNIIDAQQIARASVGLPTISRTGEAVAGVCGG